MAYRVQIAWQGKSELMARLAQLPQAMANRIQRPAVAKAGRVVANAAKATAPRETGLLKKSIGSKVKTYPSRGIVVAIIGPRRDVRGKPAKYRKGVVRTAKGKLRAASKKTPGSQIVGYRNPVNYAHLVEEGRKPVKAKGQVLYSTEHDRFFGKAVSGVTGKHFLRRALQQSKGQVIAILQREIAAGLERM